MADTSQSKENPNKEQTPKSKDKEKKDNGEDSKKEGESSKGESSGSKGEEREESKEASSSGERKPIPEDFFYEVEELWCKPLKSADDLPDDMVTLYHSFGYPCRVRSNLHAIDDNRLMFAAGAYLQILHQDTMVSDYLPTTGGGSIGALTVHPHGRLFAVGEKGSNPQVNIFTIEDYRLYRILRGGTTVAYNALSFNHSGELLATQGAEPDFMLTVWNWQQEMILLRCKSFSQDVTHVSFNRELMGALSTSGAGHIKFWKMARTFTGLKLQGAVGRAGKTELSDVEGYVEFPDGKVLSGSDWGNMLLWDDYLIKLQIGRKGGKNCHAGKIMHMMMVEGEIITTGLDGFVRSWNLELIDVLEATEESGLVEIDAMNEVLIGPNVQIYYLTQPPKARKADLGQPETNKPSTFGAHDASSNCMWYCQDGAGGIWLADLSFALAAHQPKRIFSFHAGAVVACDVSPVSHLVMTLGEDGALRLYDFLGKKLLAEKHFKAKGASLVWIPLRVDHKCSTVMAGFSDGGIRRVAISNGSAGFTYGYTSCQLKLMDALKPHEQTVTSLAYSHHSSAQGTVTLVTCSLDKTLFLFHATGETYEPLCYIPMFHAPRRIIWSPDTNTAEYFLVICDGGLAVEFIRPTEVDQKETLKCDNAMMRVFKFPSVKSQILRDEVMDHAEENEKKKQKEREQRNKELITRGIETPSQQELRIDMEDAVVAVEKRKKEEEEGPWKPYIPPQPSPILQTVYHEGNSKFWLMLGDYDAGFLYECEFTQPFQTWTSPEEAVTMADKNPPLRSIRVKDAENMPITALCFNSEGNCVFYGLQNGRIRLQFLENEFDISAARFHWSVGAHDVMHGAITGMKMSHDEAFLITVGEDSNIFIFSLLPIQQLLEEMSISQAKLPGGVSDSEVRPAEDLVPNQYTIEQAKQKTDYDKMVMLAEKRKQEKRTEIAVLRTRFKRLVAQNRIIPPNLRLTRSEFVLDECHAKAILKQNKEKVKTAQMQMAWEAEKCRLGMEKMKKHYMGNLKTQRFCVSALNTNHVIYSFRDQHHTARKLTIKAPKQQRDSDLSSYDDKDKYDTKEEELELRRLLGPPLSADAFIGMSERTAYLLKKVEQKRIKRAKRKIAWRRFLETKPADDYEDPADEAAINQAYDTLGDRHLKSEDNYIVPDSYKLTMIDGGKRLSVCEKHFYAKQQEFDHKLLALREQKVETINAIQAAVNRLEDIQNRNILEMNDCVALPHVPRMGPDERPLGVFTIGHKEERMLRNEARTKLKKMAQGTSRSNSIRRESVFNTAHRKSSLAIAKENYNKLMENMPGQENKMDPSTSTTTTDVPMMAYALSDLPMLTRMTYLENTTEMQTALIELERIKLRFQQDQVIKEIQRLMDVFDIEHRILRHEKFQLDVAMKMGQLRLNTLEEEQLVLMECESVEEGIQDRSDKCLQQKVEVDKATKLLQTQISKQTKDLEECSKEEKDRFVELEDIIGEANTFHDYLVKVYKRKMKRKVAKKATEEDEEESSESDSDSSGSSEESEEEDEDAVHYDLGICPPGCSQEIYDQVVALREKRLDLDDVVAEAKRVRDALIKDLEACNKKRQATDATYAKAHQDLALFQLEKQSRINDLDVLCVIKFHQIRAVRRNHEFLGITDELLINDTEVIRLQKRINELKNEKKDEHAKTIERRKLNLHLNHEKNNFLTRLAVFDEFCDKEMTKKFGRLVDVAEVETVTADPQIEDIRSKLIRHQAACDKEMCEVNKAVKDMRDKKIFNLRMNTEYKLVQAAQRKRQIRMERGLDQWLLEQKMIIQEDPLAIPKNCVELMDAVDAQRVAIKALTREIEYLQGQAREGKEHGSDPTGEGKGGEEKAEV